MFNKRIKELRKSLCMSQLEFSKQLHVTKQCVINWENHNVLPSTNLLIRISDTFSVSIDYLLGVENIRTIDVTGLSDIQILHIQNMVSDLKNAKR
ncbi:MAG: helix-turn-helix transcriptional regulator [Ruminococcus sp.]|nr:helix-turn-helix transcriptional regulator [Ruminococcus sp.]